MGQMTAPLVTAAPTSADSPETGPALCAVIGCSIFIASSTTIRSPASPLAPFSTATLPIGPCDRVPGLAARAVLDRTLDDRALHRRGEGVPGGGGPAVAGTPLAGLGA